MIWFKLGNEYIGTYGTPKLNASLSYLRDIYKCGQLPVTAVITTEEKKLFKKLITDSKNNLNEVLQNWNKLENFDANLKVFPKTYVLLNKYYK